MWCGMLVLALSASMMMVTTGTIVHSATDIWFPKLVEMIQSQQRRPVWMSEKKVG